MKRPGRIIAAAVAFSVALTVAGCASTAEAPSAEGTTLAVARASDVTTLNADAVASSQEGWETLQLIADSLFFIGADGVIQPRIGESYEYSDDNAQLIVNLNKDATFSDGTPVTAADVAFTVENAQKGELLGGIYASITGIETPDDHTVVFEYDLPSSGAVISLASYGVAIIPEDFGGASADDFWQDPVTAGAFTIENWEQGVGMTLVRNEDYYGTPASVERIEFTTVPDANTRLLQLQNGSVDIIDAVNTAQADQIAQSEGLSVTEFASGTDIFLTLNSTTEPFSSEPARRAVSLGIDRQQVVDAALGGLGEPGGSFIVPSAVGGFSPEFGSRFDAAAAKKELEAAGLSDGFAFEIMYNSGNPAVETAMQIVQANLADVGITVTLAGLEGDAIGAKVGDNDWNAYVANITTETDAGEVLQFYAPSNGFYSGDEAMIAKMQEYADAANADFSGQDARNAIFADAVTDIAESALQIAVYDPARLWGSSSAVGKLSPLNATGALDFSKITVTK